MTSGPAGQQALTLCSPRGRRCWGTAAPLERSPTALTPWRPCYRTYLLGSINREGRRDGQMLRGIDAARFGKAGRWSVS